MSESISHRTVAAAVAATLLLAAVGWAGAVVYGVDTQYESAAEKAYHTLMLIAMLPAGWALIELLRAVRRQEVEPDA